MFVNRCDLIIACAAYLEVDDDGPYESKSKFRVSVDDIFGSYVDYADFLVMEELQSSVDIVKHVEPHGPSFPRLKLKKKHIKYTNKQECNVLFDKVLVAAFKTYIPKNLHVYI